MSSLRASLHSHSERALGAHPERALALLLAVYALVSAWDFSGRPACIDYYQFWVVGRAVGADESQGIYSQAERDRLGGVAYQRALAEANEKTPPGAGAPVPTKRLQAARQRHVLQTYSTPWLYTLFGLFSRADYEASQGDFQLASLVGYVLAIVLLARILGLRSSATLLWIAALLQWSNPFVDDVIAGNVNRLQLLALAVFLFLGARGRFPGRHAVAGALLGATLAFKPNLAAGAVVLLLGWATSGQWRRLFESLVGLLAGALVAVAASAAFFGSFDPWMHWFRELPVITTPGSPSAGSAEEGNYSLARLLYIQGGLAVGPWIAASLFAMAFLGLFVERRRRAPANSASRPTSASDPDPSRDLLLLGAGIAVSLLSSELSWQHYFVALVPLAMALLRPAEEGSPSRTLLAAAAIVGFAMVSLQNVARLLDFHAPSTAAAVVSGGTFLLFAAALLDISRSRAPASSPA